MSGPRLITDADVLAGRVLAPILLGPGVILTPAARDRAVARGLEIVEAEDVAAWQAARAAALPSPPVVPTAAAPACGCSRGSGASLPAAPASAVPGCGCGAPGGRCTCRSSATSCGCGAPAGRCSCGTAGPGGDPTLARLADGVYLVRVRDGLVSRVRPVAGDGHGEPSAIRRAEPR